MGIEFQYYRISSFQHATPSALSSLAPASKDDLDTCHLEIFITIQEDYTPCLMRLSKRYQDGAAFAVFTSIATDGTVGKLIFQGRLEDMLLKKDRDR